MSPAQRSSRIGRAPRTRATAFALAALLAGGGQATQAAPLTPEEKAAAAEEKAAKAEASAKKLAEAKEAATKADTAAQAAAKLPIPVIEGGKATRQMTADEARKSGLTVVDL